MTEFVVISFCLVIYEVSLIGPRWRGTPKSAMFVCLFTPYVVVCAPSYQANQSIPESIAALAVPGTHLLIAPPVPPTYPNSSHTIHSIILSIFHNRTKKEYFKGGVFS